MSSDFGCNSTRSSRSPENLAKRPARDVWSSQNTLAHLARYHELFLARLERILSEDNPAIERYHPERDPAFGPWLDRPWRISSQPCGDFLEDAGFSCHRSTVVATGYNWARAS